MRAEDRDPWKQWWNGVGRRQLVKSLARWGYDEFFVPPILAALRSGATVLDLERQLSCLRFELELPGDVDTDGWCAIEIAIWWDQTTYSRRRFGAS